MYATMVSFFGEWSKVHGDPDGLLFTFHPELEIAEMYVG
jgi:hypothetical protein